jgi:hypothetical protein
MRKIRENLSLGTNTIYKTAAFFTWGHEIAAVVRLSQYSLVAGRHNDGISTTSGAGRIADGASWRQSSLA